MTTATYVSTAYAPNAVTCPLCQAKPGTFCQSTGGGNGGEAPTHAARRKRVQGWDQVFAGQASEAARHVVRASWELRASVDFSRFEAAATPIPVKVDKPVTPRRLKITHKQAQTIEWYAEHGGSWWAPTSHFHGDHSRRQTIHSLEGKNVLARGDMTGDGERLMSLTAFGWAVYRDNWMINRKLTPDQIDAAEKKAQANR